MIERIRTINERYEAYLIEGHARPNVLYIYWVTGNGDFPIDMLRYDCCWPSENAARMCLDTYSSTREDRMKLRTIKMHSYKEPTIDRWSSFGWSVGFRSAEAVNAS